MKLQTIASLRAVMADMRMEAHAARESAVGAGSLVLRSALVAEAVCIEHWVAQIQRALDDEDDAKPG